MPGIAISTAGIVNEEAGIVEYALSIPGYTGTPWKERLESEFHLPVSVENDTNCAALGEYWLGAGQGVSSFFAVTVGTSIGGAAVKDGKVLHGATHAAGEIAYMRLPAGQFHDVASAAFLCREIAKEKSVPEQDMDGYRAFQLIEEATSRPFVVSTPSAKIWPTASPISSASSILNESSSAAAS